NATMADTDEEGLRDGEEIFRYRTNPLLPDTDFDTLTDWDEVRIYRTNPLTNDTDQEGLYDDEEVLTFGTNPNNPDTDRDGVSDYAEVVAGTNPLNAPPTASFGLKRDVYRNIAVVFDGTKSHDNDGTIVSYSWVFGDGGTANTAQPTHTFTQIGRFSVLLTVTDDDGESGFTNVSIMVLNQLPAAEAGEDQSVFTGFTVDFQATPGSTDPDGTIVSYEWNFMDGSNGTGQSTTHVYGVAGTYYVTLTVTDNDGGKDTDTVVITAETPKPPDLLVSSESITFFAAGGNVVLSMTIENDGDLDASSTSFKLSDESTSWISSERHTPGVNARSSFDFNVVLPSEPIGSHRIKIEVDSTHEIDEADETNNIIYITIPDADQDSLSDFGETMIGADPNSNDSDADGLKDGPLVNDSTGQFPVEQDWNIDTDGDGLINVLDADSDNDEIIDGYDIDPLHDLLLKVKINSLDIEDPIDFETVLRSRTIRIPYPSCYWWGCKIKYRSLTVYYPAIEENRRAEPFFRVQVTDNWDSTNWMHSEVPVAEDTSYYSPGSPPLFVANVPDYAPTVAVTVEAWDVDIAEDDQLDLYGFGSSSWTTFELDTAAQYLPGEYVTSVSSSGSFDGSTSSDTDDATIRYSIYIDYELSYQEQMELAEKFLPQLYIDVLETWHPRDISEFLDNAVLMDDADNPVIYSPTPENLTDYIGPAYYLDLNDTYHNQDTSTDNLKIYAHVFTSYREVIVIQYWFFYLYNDWINNHEGDWEMIQLILPAQGAQDIDALVPMYAGYSWHNHIKKSGWIWGSLTIDSDTHPVVYVGVGGHASRFTPLGIYLREEMSQYSLELITNQGWLRYSGLWGDKSDSIGGSGIPGPVFRSGLVLDSLHLIATFGSYRGYMWTDPVFWFQFTTAPPTTIP
ncbi:MAG: PKD domain-containing protein, partial [Candidatus Thorarchaeota archaeon]